MIAPHPAPNNRPDQIVEHAAHLLVATHAIATRRERRQQRRLAAIVDDTSLRNLTFALTDEVLRIEDHRRAARRFRSIIDEFGVPRSLGRLDRGLLFFGSRLAVRVHPVVMPLVRARLLREAAGVVLSADDPAFADHLARRHAQGCRVNVNVLGEAILSDAEAANRLDMVLQRIARPDVEYVSLKISAICANLDVLAFDASVDRIATQLRTVYRAARRSVPPTFVNLDMEEYRDLGLTIAALTRVLDEDEFAAMDAGIVLQAYLPDAHAACAQLCEWAHDRHHRAGGTLKIRVVKGANLAMERVDAELHGWDQAPYTTKLEVDASFKRLVETALDDRWAGSVRVGIASHNLFDLAWALSLPCRERIDIEMLEGMAPAQSRAVQREAHAVLLYAPVVRHDDLPASIAYLTRRLDENTSPDNFLRALFTLQVDSAEWHEQRQRFEAALASRLGISTASRRAQDRSTPSLPISIDAPFENAADTDWASAANRRWIATEMASVVWPHPADALIETVAGINEVVTTARRGSQNWTALALSTRRQMLLDAATVMENQRGRTLALMANEAGKTLGEGDAEVSEAVDFARFYARSMSGLDRRAAAGHEFQPAGVVVVASPWNFPYAIPAGGVLAALAAGNAVIVKPAPEVRATARLLVEQLWEAGIPRDAVQFVACPDDEVGRHLVTHDLVSTVLLTGAYETASRFLDWKPSMRLLAETSGKNAIIITAAADEDAAIRDLIRSAFGHAGQKCSAASLAIVEASIYDDPRFRRRLADAVQSLRIGPATDPATMMGPLISPPAGALRRALTALEPGEIWLVEPRALDDSDVLWSPGVRWGVRPGSWFHRTECFGPVLGVIRAVDLDDAIRIQNGGDYGLTGGIQSLDDAEVEHWLATVEVGNAYVNRHITGAIVQRQPFGGWKRSSVGCGAKAGGPSFVETLGTWKLGTGTPDGPREFATAWAERFRAAHDPTGLRSERNVLRYRPLGRVGLVVGADADPTEIATARLGARTAGVTLIDLAHGQLVDASTVDRVRVVGTITDEQRRVLRRAGPDLDETPPIPVAEIELRHWVREQAISWTRHRHGRLHD